MFDSPDFEAIAVEDAERIALLELGPADVRRVTEIYNRWLKILFGDAGKQLPADGLRPRPSITLAPGEDVRRSIILRWGNRPQQELFAQIWIDTSGAQPEVKYRFNGYGYPPGNSIAF